MKFLVILCMAFMATSGSVLYYQPQTVYSAVPVKETVISAPVRTQYHAQTENGQYAYGYAHEGGTYKMEAKGADGAVHGQYGYTAPDGRRIEIKYKADDVNGFVATGGVIPKSVEVPAMVPLADAYYVTSEKKEEESYKPVKVEPSYEKPEKVDSGYEKPGKEESGYEQPEKGEVPYIPPPEEEKEGIGAYYFSHKVPYTHYIHPFLTQPQPQLFHSPIVLKTVPAKSEVTHQVVSAGIKPDTFPVHYVTSYEVKNHQSPKVEVAAVKPLHTIPVQYVAPYPVHYVPSAVPIHAVKVEQPKIEKAEPAPSLSKKY